MKIALVIERMDPVRGGRETYTARLAEQLVGMGHEVTVMCQKSNWDFPGVFIMEFDRIGFGRLQQMRNFLNVVQETIASGVYDIVHAMLPIPGVDIYHPHGGAVKGSMEASLRRRAAVSRPFARVLKKFNRCRNESARLERQIVNDPRTLCVCVSRLIADQFAEIYGRYDRARVVFNGVSTPPADGNKRKTDRERIRGEIAAGENDPVFLTVCTNFPLKGVAESIEAFAGWIKRSRPQGNPRYVIVGREKVDKYRKLARKLGVENSVLFVPPTRDIFQWYAACDVFCLLTWYDPCSLTVLEAGMWGIPSITTSYNGAAYAFSGGGCIVIDSPRDIDDAVEAFGEMANPEPRKKHSLACRQLNQKLSNQRHVEELLDVYRQAIELKKSH